VKETAKNGLTQAKRPGAHDAVSVPTTQELIDRKSLELRSARDKSELISSKIVNAEKLQPSQRVNSALTAI
jgi:hypothetical protein